MPPEWNDERTAPPYPWMLPELDSIDLEEDEPPPAETGD